MALLALLLGTSVYLFDRPWSSTIFLSGLVEFEPARYPIFGAWGGSLPSLLHAVAFSLLLIVALRPTARGCLGVCCSWFTIAAGLELLQANPIAAYLATRLDLLPDTRLLAGLRAYMLQGHFDLIDLIATALGCGAALIIARLQRRTTCIS